MATTARAGDPWIQTREVGARQEHQATTEDERAWAEGIRRGDPAAFEAMVRAFGPSLVRFAYGCVRDSADAEDIVHDVLWRIWDGRERWEAPTSLRAYLFIAVRNRSRYLSDKQQVRTKYTLRVREEREGDQGLVTMPDPAEELERHEATARKVGLLRQAFQHLTARQQDALRLRYEVGMTYPELGPALGLTQRGGEQLLSRAMKALRKALQELDG
jgi:RNA polymerase sigma-70 factor (ECF subfamily)